MSTLDRWLGEMNDTRSEARARMRDMLPRRGPSPMTTALTALAGAAIGAALAFFLDPQRGRSRRARYLDQAGAAARDLMNGASRTARRVGNDAQGFGERLSHPGGGALMPSDAALTDKVETELFADQRIPKGKININVEEGVVVLRGEVDTSGEADELIRKAQRIPGVARVDSLLHLPGEPAPPEPPRQHAKVTTGGPEGPLPH
ncbi:MAG TPA: BON domain-containing protein [Candidatus Limnocylindria bacterium]|nr:BON domain-containing protein [Candidatus Limnocylindria bacterium]